MDPKTETATRGVRHRRPAVGLAIAILLIGATACGGDDDASADTSSDSSASGDRSAHTFVALDAGGPITKEALASGEVDVAVLFTSSADEEANDWVHLADDRGLQPAEHFVPAIRSDATDDTIAATLDAASAELNTLAVQLMVARVANGRPATAVAAEFLANVDIPGATELDLAGPDRGLTVGSASFPESELAGEIYTQALLGAGIAATHTPDLGFREVYLPALEDGDIDLVPEFIGSLLTYLGGAPTDDLESSLAALTDAAAARGITLLAPAPAQSQNGFYVTADTAAQLGLESLSDLATLESPLVFGGPAECPDRPLCVGGLVDVYGVEFDV